MPLIETPVAPTMTDVGRSLFEVFPLLEELEELDSRDAALYAGLVVVAICTQDHSLGKPPEEAPFDILGLQRIRLPQPNIVTAGRKTRHMGTVNDAPSAPVEIQPLLFGELVPWRTPGGLAIYSNVALLRHTVTSGQQRPDTPLSLRPTPQRRYVQVTADPEPHWREENAPTHARLFRSRSN